MIHFGISVIFLCLLLSSTLSNRLVCEVLPRCTKKSQVSPPHPKCPPQICASTNLGAGLQSYVPRTWQVCERVLKICAMTSYMTYNKLFGFCQVILAARNTRGMLNMRVNNLLGCLGRQGSDSWGGKECAQGVFVVSGLPAPWEGAERQLRTVWLLRVRVWIKPQRRGTEQEERVWPELPQAEEGGKVGVLESEWVCWGRIR